MKFGFVFLIFYSTIVSSQNKSLDIYQLNNPNSITLINANQTNDSFGFYSICKYRNPAGYDTLELLKINLNNQQIIEHKKSFNHNKRAYLHVDSFNNLFVLRHSYGSTIAPYTNIEVIKIDQNFNPIWSKSYDSIKVYSTSLDNTASGSLAYIFDKVRGFIFLSDDKLVNVNLNGNVSKVKRVEVKSNLYKRIIPTTFTKFENRLFIYGSFDTNTNKSRLLEIDLDSMNILRERTNFKNSHPASIFLGRTGKFYGFSNRYYTYFIDTNFKYGYGMWVSELNNTFTKDSNGIFQLFSIGNEVSLSGRSIQKYSLDSNFNILSARVFLYENRSYTNNYFRMTNFFSYKNSQFINALSGEGKYLELFKFCLDSLYQMKLPNYELCARFEVLKDSIITDTMIYLSNSSYSSIASISNPFNFVSANLQLLSNDTPKQGCLSAYFPPLPKNTFCINETPSIYSDTCVRHGVSTWKLSYPSDSDEWIDYNYENIVLKQKGRVKIHHIYEIAGCRDTFSRYITVLDSAGYNFLNLGNDTTFCGYPFSKKLNAYHPAYSGYLWSTGSTDSSITISDTGTYWVRVGSLCGTQSDTLRISYNAPPKFNLLAHDTLAICSQLLPYKYKALKLDTSHKYSWSHGGNEDSTQFTSFVVYYLSVNNGCYIIRDTITVIMRTGASTTPPTHPDSVSLCATTYKITRPQNLRLEEKFVNSWLNRDSLILTKNQKLVFRWTDSCSTINYDSIYDYQRGNFPPLPKSQKLCETFASFITNTQTTITQYEFKTSWQLNNNISLQLGPNYIRRDDNCGNMQFDTILGFSTKQPKNLIAEDSLVLCPQEFPYTLTISDTFKTYLWSNGFTTSSSKLVASNSYLITVTDNCYTYNDSIQVKEITTPNEIALEEIYRELCKALEKTRVETKLVYPQYIWNQAPSTKFFFIADTSQNLVTIYIPRRCDTLKDSLSLSWIDPALLPPSYTVDSSYCKQAEGAVKLTLNNKTDYLSYQWKGDSLPYIFVNTLGTTKFFARNLCYEKYFDLPSYSCPLDPIGLPQAFSPNGDNLNDSWGLQGAKNIILYNLSIFNRWGEKIFETTDPNIQWNGSYKGEPAPTGIYGYTLDYEYTPQSIRRVQSGEVMVVR